VYAAALAIAGVASYLVLFRQLGGNIAVLTFCTASITVLLGAAVRELTASLAAQKDRVERLAVLGRFSSQLAHDMKNPIATLRGALQFLQEERARGRSLDAQAEFLDIMLQEVDRLHRVVDDYQRIGRVEPILRPVDINDLVRGVVALEPFAAKEGIAIRSELAADLPACQLDGDLVSGALQNVIRNACEAMPEGGKVTVRTERAADGVVISVEDSGNGMDARQAERALDEFYSTKPTGSGLGLAFVRRVAHAHGGDVSLKTTKGEGTIVRLRFSAE
jgi:signal transduction histidine kinase